MKKLEKEETKILIHRLVFVFIKVPLFHICSGRKNRIIHHGCLVLHSSTLTFSLRLVYCGLLRTKIVYRISNVNDIPYRTNQVVLNPIRGTEASNIKA